MNDYVVMDAETQLLAEEIPGGWDNVFGMKMASAVTYDSKTDNYDFWTDREKLNEYLNNKTVVTFNGIHFDSVLLLGSNRIIELDGKTRNEKFGWHNIDIYLEMWRRIMKMDKSNYPKIVEEQRKQRPPKGVFNLGVISEATLHHTKTGYGELAPQLFKEGRWAELFQYNLQDVRITKELFQFILKYRYLVTGSYDIVKFL